MKNGKISTLFKISFKLIIACLFLALPFSGIAQYDYEHYVPPFYYGGSSNSVIGTHTVVLSTNSANNVKVYIETGNGTPYAGPFTIIRGAPVEYVFKTPEENDNEVGNIISYPEQYDFPYGVVGAKELNTPLMDQGLRFYSYDGPFFVNIRHSAEHHGGSLTTKGTYAKGTEFRSGHLYNYNFNEAYWGYYRNSQLQVRSHFISVMATEDNTEVNFSDIKCSYISEYLHGDAALNAKAVGPNDIIHITLMKGQSYVLAVDFELSGFYDLGTNGWNGLNGTSVTSTKPIVVNSGSWAVGADDSQDIGFDQIVPVDQIRDEYIVLRGKGEIASNEHPIVVATEDNTEIFINGDPVPHYTIAKKGDFAILDEFTHNINLKSLYINTKGKNIYVYQTLSGYKDRTNIGLNFIPPLSSTGMSEVTIPFADYLAKKELAEAVITILAQKNAVVKYQTTVNGVTSGFSTLTNSSDIPGNTEWVSYTIQGNVEGNYRFNSNKAINVAWVVYHDWLGAAGYYSGFTKAIPKIIPDLNTSLDTDLGVICESYDEQISVSVNEPLPDFYEWYVDEITGNPITSNGALVVDAPNEETTYYVVGYYMDTSLDFLFNGDFSDGTNRIKSDYDQVYGNLRNPGEFAISFDSKSENPIFEDFGSMDGNGMFMAYSKNQGDTIYKHLDFPVEEDNSYIIKLFGTLAVKDDVNYFDQSLKVLVNDEVIIENFNITKTGIDEWQSALGYWKSGTARDASISILNNNASGKESVFALDSITFAPAVQDTAAFVARVVPNYSYGNNGETVRFCQGTANSLDVSNGDTSWYDYSWSKKNESEVYDDLSDGTEFSGSKTHELIFANPQKVNEGEYRCTIGFKPEYQQCGSSESTVNVDLTVFVDEEATVSIDADRTSFCSGGSAVLNALVTGDYGDVKWYVDGGASPVSLENPYTFKETTGMYTVRCEAENGCGIDFDEVVINVLSTPELQSLTVSDNLCEGQDIILTAVATGEGTLTYNWKKGSETLLETGGVLNYTASILDRESIFSVNVTSVYTMADETVECSNSNTLAALNLDIFPLVQFDQSLADATVCEGDNHTFSVDMKYPGDFYTYQWFKDGTDQLNNLSAHILSAVDPAVDAGNYRVDVSNRCGSDFSSADLIVTPGIVVNDFSLDQVGPFCGPTNVTATFNVVNNGAIYIYQVIEPGGSPITITNPYTFTLDTSNQGEWEFLVSSDCDPAISFERSLNMHSDFGMLSVDDIGTCIGENVTFEAKVSVIPVASDLHYAWTDNTGNPIGTDSDKLELSNVQDANFGTYSVTVTDDQCGNTKTATADLTKEAVFSPATATTPVCVGDSFSTTIAYIGSPTFEWRFNDPNSSTIIGTNETFSIANVSVTDAGIYYCTVKLVCKDVVIQSELKVNEHISLVNSGNEAVHICEGEEPILEVSVDGNADDYTIQWTDATDTDLGFEDVNHVQLTAHNTPGTYTYKAKVDGLCEDLEKLFIVTVHEKPALATVDNSLELCSGTISIEVTETGEHNGIVWWKEGLEITDGNTNDTNFVINPASSPTDDGTYIAKVGSDYCGNNQVSVNLDVRNTIAVTGQSPATTVVCENDATNLYVTATGDDIVYKWYKSTDAGTTLSDQSNLDLENISLSQTGEYKCELSNDLNCGNQTLIFNVVVNENPIVTNPTDQVICETQASVNFTITGTAQGTVNYQWYDKDDNTVGTNNSTLTVSTPENGQSYYCVVSGDACGIATSEKATVTVINEVTVTNPVDREIADGADASFTVIASGEPTYSYRWQENSGSGWIDLSDGGRYSGTTTATLQITNADKTSFDGNQYQCKVSSSGAICSSNVTSNAATLTVTSVIKIAKQPANGAEVCFNADAILSIEGNTSGLIYTWQYHKGSGTFVDAAGEEGMTASLDATTKISTLTIPATDLDINNWRFRCLVSDGVSTDEYSNEIGVKVLEDIVITLGTTGFDLCVNDVLAMSVSAAGDHIKYKWYKDSDSGTTLSTSKNFGIGNVVVGDAGAYTCEVYNKCSVDDVNFTVDVKEPATVTNPADVTMCETDINPVFTVVAGGDAPYSYQWYDNAGAISGATSDSYTEVTPVDGQSYYCEVTNSCNTIASQRAGLTVVDELVVTNPVDLIIADGANAEFRVTASGEPNYSYQWQEDSGSGFVDLSDGGKYSGATTATLTITNAVKADFDNNQYRCIVNTDGTVCIPTVTSGTAVLTVNTVIKIARQAKDAEVCFNADAILSIEGTSDGLTYTWEYDDGGGFANAGGALGMSVVTIGKVSTLTVPATDLDISNWTFRCLVGDGVSTDEYSNEIFVKVLEDIVITPGTTGFDLCVNDALAMSVSAAGDHIKYRWYKDSDSGTTLSTSKNFGIGNVVVGDAGAYTCEVYNELHCNDQTVNFTVDVKEPATVTNPADVTMCETDTNPVFTVIAGGDAPYSYQWYDNAGAISGATSDSYTEVTPVDGQSYYCEVSNLCNTIASQRAGLTVVDELAVTNPVNLTIADGAHAEFSITASGEPNYSYQWQEDSGSGFADLSDGGKYSGATTATLTITNAIKADFDNNQYRCIVNTDGTVCTSTVTSGVAVLTVNDVDKILIQPNGAEVCFNADAILSIEGNTAGLIYTWQYHKGSGTFVDAAGEEGMTVSLDVTTKISTLTIPATDLDINNWTFRCLVSDGVSTDEYSNEIGVKVLEDIVITPGTTGFDLCVNDALAMSVSATGDRIKYRWYKDSDSGTTLSTSKNFGIGNVVVGDAGAYTCEIYNKCSVDDVNFTVDVKEPATVTNPADVTMCETDINPVFTVVAGGDAPYSYQWYDNSGAISGATSDSYTEVTPVDGQSYYCEVTNSCNTIASQRASLTVVDELAVTNPVDLTIADGANAEFRVTASGEPTYSYQWQEDSGSGFVDLSDGGKYSGTTTSTLTITNVIKAGFDNNQYRCIVNTDGTVCIPTVTSGTAVLTVNTVIKIARQAKDAEVCFNADAILSIEGTSDGLTYTWEYDDGGGFSNADGALGMSVVTIGKVSTLTVPATDLDINNWTFRCLVSDGLSTDEYSNEIFVKVLEDIVITPGTTGFDLCVNDALTMSVSATGDRIKYRWYKDSDSGTTLSTSKNFGIGNVVVGDAGAYTCEIYNELHCNDQTVNFTVDVKEPAIVSVLADYEMCASDAIPTFTVIPGGDAPYSYQWYDNSGAISGATSDSYTEVTPVDGQSYYCEVTNSCNSVNSNVAVLTVFEEVSILNQPIDNNVVDGGSAEFTVSALGESVITYQWQENTGSGWNDISNGGKYSGSDLATLQIANVNKANFDGNEYRCIIRNDCSLSVTSVEVSLNVYSLIKIFKQPQNLELCLGSAGEFIIEGTSSTLTYNWEYSTDLITYNSVGGVTGLSVDAIADGSKLKIDAATIAMNSWAFRCIVTDGSSTDETSHVVSVGVSEPVSFDPIDNQNLCFGVSKQIELTNLTGTGSITYSWTKDGTEVSTTANVSIAAGDNGNYQVTASNGSVCPNKTDDFDVLHYSALSLDSWSNADQVCNGQSEVLNVGIASKDVALTETYQWYKDGSPIATTSSYNLVATNKNQSGNYKVEVSDGCSTKSVSGYVNVYEPIRTTNTWDAGITLCLGEELKLETKVTGDVISYTWTKDGTGIAANSIYLKSSIDAIDAGTYTCTVTGKCGTPLVYTIDVIVLEAPKIVTGIDVIPAVCEGDLLQLGTVVSGSYDEIVWTLNDNSENNTAGTILDLGSAELSEEGNYKVTVSNSCGEDVSVGNQVINPIPALDPLNPQTVCQGDGVVFRANAVGRDLTYQWLVEGVDQLNNSPELILDASVVLSLDENTKKTYNVECKIVGGNGCGNDTESTTLTVVPNTVLQATLQNVVKYVGDSCTMEVDITGSDLVFEWTHEVDGIKTILTGETGSKIEFTDISMADAGYYNCKIVGACGQRLASGKLTVKEPVSINSGLANFEEKCVGDPLSLSINATGQITSVKWFKDDVLLPNTELNFYISDLDLGDAAVYRCEIEGEGISVINESVTVRVYSQTVLNTPLEDKILCENSSIDWSPDVTGTSDLSYKWTVDGAEIHDQKILHYDALALNQEGDYEVQITSLCGDVTTSANLEIIQLPILVSATAGDTVCENEPLVEFSVDYEGENLRYQWRKNGVDISGETTPTISLTSIQLDDEGDYNCRVYSTCGEGFSPIATLTIIPQLKINSESVDVEVCEGEEVLFTTDVTGNDVSYQWKLDGVDIPGEVGSSYAIAESNVNQSGYYTCIVSDICTDSRSTKPAELSVNALPDTEIFGRMVLCAKEDRVTYVTIDQPKTEYGWGVVGGLFAGPEEGLRTRITWSEVANGSLSVMISNLETGCKSQVDSLVTLNALPAVKLVSISSKGECEGEFELTGGYPDGGIYWINGISETVFNPSDRGAGEYAIHYSYTDENGCSNVTSTTTLQVDVLPVVDITDDITVGSCIPTNLAADTDEDNIQWFQQQGNNWILPVNLDNPKSMTPTFTPGESQVLMARVQDEHGCEGVDLINLSVAPLPVVTTINDTTVSQCNQLQLKTDIVGDEDVISWTNPDHLDRSDIRSPKIIDAPEGTYTYSISVTDLYGCDATDEVTVNMVADPKLGEDKFGCEGETFEVSISGMENPVWDDAYTDEQRTIKTPGRYHLEVSNEFGCEDEQEFVINPTPDLGLKDTLIFEGQTVTLAPNLPSDYAPYFFEWQDGSILQRFEVSETGIYKLSVQDNLGCQAIDSAYVEVKPVGIESPNAFTPESNNDNSRFYLKDINVVEEFEMYVYDRWGELLFKSNETGYNGGWDGKYKGKLCPTGAYVWIAFINGEYTNKGTFMLLR